jgi:hypothetical protein
MGEKGADEGRRFGDSRTGKEEKEGKDARRWICPMPVLPLLPTVLSTKKSVSNLLFESRNAKATREGERGERRETTNDGSLRSNGAVRSYVLALPQPE